MLKTSKLVSFMMVICLLTTLPGHESFIVSAKSVNPVNYILDKNDQGIITVETVHGSFSVSHKAYDTSAIPRSRITANLTEKKEAVTICFDEQDEMLNENLFFDISVPEGGYVLPRVLSDDDTGLLEVYNSDDIMIGCIINIVWDYLSDDHNVTTVGLKTKKQVPSRAEDDPEVPGGYYIVVMGFSFYFEDFFSSGSWIIRSGELSLSLTRILSLWYQRLNGVFFGDERVMALQTWSLVRARFRYSSNWSNEQGLWEQYWCHVKWAGNKNPYNLEPWREAVGEALTILNGCNP